MRVRPFFFICTMATAALCTASTFAGGDPCNPGCPEGALLEAEACGADTNGGCNAPPSGSSNCCTAWLGLGCDDVTCQDTVCSFDPYCCSVQWDGFCVTEATSSCGDLCAPAVDPYEAIACGDTVCGTFWADGSFRDTDWYTFSLDTTTEVTWSVASLTGVAAFILDSNCPPFVIAVGAGACPTTVTYCLDAGSYVAFVAPNVFAGVPCGSGDANNYVATLTCGGACVPPACGGETTGDCCVASATPFCNDAACCEAVCAADPFCCSNSWDGICAGEAAGICWQICGPDCDLTCPEGALSEAEACGADTNGGCNAPPAGSSNCCTAWLGLGCDDVTCQDTVCSFDPYCCSVQWDGFCVTEATSSCGDLCAPAAAYEVIACGETVCGTFWADGSFRDTDWYSFTLEAATEVTWSVRSVVPAQLFLLDSACPPFVFADAAGANCPTEVTYCLEAGSYVAFVAPSIFAGVPCGSGEGNNYVATLTCGGTCVPPACGAEGTGDCCVAGATPYCNDLTCCEAVCAADPFCCNTAWDGVCAGEAAAICFELCGPDCDLTCPEGASLEGEACGADTNGGCNAPPSGSSNCCTAWLGLGCDDVTCQDTVCSFDPYCCSVQWDGFCVTEATSSCGDLCAPAAAFEAIACGETVCGTFWADGSFRDTDWYEFTLESAAEVTLSVKSVVPAQLFFLDTACPPAILASVAGASCPTELTFCFPAGGTYRAFVAPTIFSGLPCGSGDGNNYVATLTCGPACDALENDECDGALAVVDGANDVDTFTATGALELPAECLSAGSSTIFNDAWYSYTATATGTVTVSTCDSVNFDSRLAVFSGSCAEPVFVACNDDFGTCGGFTSELTFEAECGETYLIVLGSFTNGVTGSGTLNITPSGECPSDCVTDLDNDGDTDAADLAILLGNWGQVGLPGDFDNDGVAADDLAVLLGGWGPCE